MAYDPRRHEVGRQLLGPLQASHRSICAVEHCRIYRFPNDLGTYTLRDILVFYAKRRLKPRYDKNTDTIYIDGIEQKCRSLESVDAEVQ